MLDQLKSTLMKQSDIVIQKSLDSKDHVSKADIEKLDRMARLVEIKEICHPEPKCWPLIVLFGTILFIVSVLLFFRLNQTEIELDLSVSEFQFNSSEKKDPQIFTEAFNVDELKVSGFSEISFPKSAKEPSVIFKNKIIKIVALNENNERGMISLGTIILPSKTSVQIISNENPNDYSFIFKDTPIDLKITICGPIEIRSMNVSPMRLYFKNARAINLVKKEANKIRLELIAPNTSKRGFSREIEVRSLLFSSAEDYFSLDSTVLHTLSTVYKGTLFYEALKGKKISLRGGYPIRFEEIDGVIQGLQLFPDRITLKFYGKVSGMESGTKKNPIYLMPTWLEYLRANQVIALVWGTTVSIFCLIFSILRWYKRM